jgi:hypothetical protein
MESYPPFLSNERGTCIIKLTLTSLCKCSTFCRYLFGRDKDFPIRFHKKNYLHYICQLLFCTGQDPDSDVFEKVGYGTDQKTGFGTLFSVLSGFQKSPRDFGI